MCLGSGAQLDQVAAGLRRPVLVGGREGVVKACVGSPDEIAELCEQRGSRGL